MGYTYPAMNVGSIFGPIQSNLASRNQRVSINIAFLGNNGHALKKALHRVNIPVIV